MRGNTTPEPCSAPEEPWRYEAVGESHIVIDAEENEIARFSAERPARLCAAAPELLEAAKEARDELSEYLAPWAERLAARLDEAIKEAEGQIMSASFWLLLATEMV